MKLNSLFALVVATFVITGVLSMPVIVQAQESVPVQNTGENLNVVLHTPNPLNTSVWLFGAFIMGLIGGALFAIKNPFEILNRLEEKNPGAFSYLILGWLALLSVGVVGYLGLIVVLVVFGLYHLMKGSLSQNVRDIVSSVKLPTKAEAKSKGPDTLPVDISVPETIPVPVDISVPETIPLDDEIEQQITDNTNGEG